MGVVSIETALETAQKDSLDLVEISPDSTPPVCKVMDYGKHVFDIKKKAALQKKKQKQTQVKEIKFRPVTDTGDYNIKLKRINEFLESGHKVKVVMRFRFRRELTSKDFGDDMLNKLIEDLQEIGQVDSMPKHEGRQMTMILSPKTKRS